MFKPTHELETLTIGENIARATFVKKCDLCKAYTIITVNKNDYITWSDGELIQNVWPELTAEQREILISGTHSDCWDYIMPPEDLEEDDDL